LALKKILTVAASFVIMLIMGSVYAWSIIASELMEIHNFSGSQSQIIFGTLIGIFPVTMIITGALSHRIKYRYFGYLSGILFFSGYFLAGFSSGSFLIVLVGIGILAGIGTGLGYWVSITAPVQWYPEKKGLITGITSAGFGLGAIFMAEMSKYLLANSYDILEILKIVGIAYGTILILVTFLINQREFDSEEDNDSIKGFEFIKTSIFKKLLLGLFLGTFAGLLIIGSLRNIGSQYDITEYTLILGVSIFATSNFLGRLFWGFFSDHINGNLSIFLSLLFQSVSILLLTIINLSDTSYLVLVFCIGFGYGSNFVLFAKETAQVFGVKRLGVVYPYVFLGYSIAGMLGPFSGGSLFDLSNTFTYAIILAGIMSLLGSLLFMKELVTQGNKN
jgi:OFA family oxalate/formate antiporter-like MFS transporter